MLLPSKQLQDTDHTFEVYISEQAAKPATPDQTEDTNEQQGSEKTILRRDDYPDCDGSGHGYAEIYYSDGTMEIEEY